MRTPDNETASKPLEWQIVGDPANFSSTIMELSDFPRITHPNELVELCVTSWTNLRHSTQLNAEHILIDRYVVLGLCGIPCQSAVKRDMVRQIRFYRKSLHVNVVKSRLNEIEDRIESRKKKTPGDLLSLLRLVPLFSPRICPTQQITVLNFLPSSEG